MQKGNESSSNLPFLEAFAVSFRKGIFLGGVLVVCVDSTTSIWIFLPLNVLTQKSTQKPWRSSCTEIPKKTSSGYGKIQIQKNPPTMFCLVIHLGRFPPKSKNKPYHDMDIFQKHKNGYHPTFPPFFVVVFLLKSPYKNSHLAKVPISSIRSASSRAKNFTWTIDGRHWGGEITSWEHNTSPPPCSRHHAGGSPAKGTYIPLKKRNWSQGEGEGRLRSAELTVTRNVLMICFARIWNLKLSLKKLHV